MVFWVEVEIYVEGCKENAKEKFALNAKDFEEVMQRIEVYYGDELMRVTIELLSDNMLVFLPEDVTVEMMKEVNQF